MSAFFIFFFSYLISPHICDWNMTLFIVLKSLCNTIQYNTIQIWRYSSYGVKGQVTIKNCGKNTRFIHEWLSKFVIVASDPEWAAVSRRD